MNINKLLIFLLLIPAVTAVSISPYYMEIQFEPNAEKNVTFFVDGDNLEPYIEGNFSGYVTLSPVTVAGERSMFTAMITMPHDMDPGKHRITIGVREKPAGQGLMTASTAVQAPVIIVVPETLAVLPEEGVAGSDHTGIIIASALILLVALNIFLFLRKNK